VIIFTELKIIFFDGSKEKIVCPEAGERTCKYNDLCDSITNAEVKPKMFIKLLINKEFLNEPITAGDLQESIR